MYRSMNRKLGGGGAGTSVPEDSWGPWKDTRILNSSSVLCVTLRARESKGQIWLIRGSIELFWLFDST